MTTIRLGTPIQHNGNTIRAIQLRQPGKAARKRILAAQSIADPLTATIAIVAALTGLDEAQVEQLAPDDFHAVTEAAIKYMRRGRP